MIKTEAVICDKDGTLIDFDAFWVAVSKEAISKIAERYGAAESIEEKILAAFGVNNGVTDPDGVLCKGTYEEMGDIVFRILWESEISCERSIVIREVVDAYNSSADSGEVRATSEKLAQVLSELKARGKRLAVVTTDNEVITKKCLRSIGIEHIFDKIYTDNGIYPTKPDPYCALDFCAELGVEPCHTVMVGDTVTDMKFAKNAGLVAIGIGNSEKKREGLAPLADALISDMSELPALLN